MVLAGTRFACIRISGRATFTLAVDFKTLMTALAQKGCVYFVIDLAQCSLMDSTFMGVLAGFGLKMNQAAGESRGPAVELPTPGKDWIGFATYKV